MNTESIEALRTKAQNAVVQALGDAYDCERCWSAWGWGTMGEEDFTLVAENPDRVAEITDAVLDAVKFNAIMAQIDVLLPDADIVETAREGMEVHEDIINSPEYRVCAELVRLSDAYETLLTQHPELRD